MLADSQRVQPGRGGLSDGQTENRPAVEELTVVTHDLAQRRISTSLAEGQAATEPHRRLRHLRGEPVAELADERALADSRLTHDRRDRRLTAAGDTHVEISETRQLTFAADDAARCRILGQPGSRPKERTTNNSAGLPFRLERFFGSESKGVPCRRDSPLPDEYLPRLGPLLEASRDVDSITCYEGAAL